MYRGLYTLTSGMMTQQTNLNTISNNMSNISTQGFKADTLVTTTFEDVLLSRTGNRDKSANAPMGTVSMVRVPDGAMVDYEQGAAESTGRAFDFALNGEGFFEIEQQNGAIVYTRDGSFTLDDEGYLYLQHVGRVMGQEGPIWLGSDKFTVSPEGEIVLDAGGYTDTLRVVDFVDYTQLQKTGEGMFVNGNQGNAQPSNAVVMQKFLEKSNVQVMDEMVGMMSSQRALQSASQMIKIYDMLMNKAANDIGRI